MVILDADPLIDAVNPLKIHGLKLYRQKAVDVFGEPLVMPGIGGPREVDPKRWTETSSSPNV
ncbi:MAG: hypothetical protein K8R36_19295 [Planctomycetales bacterium]|nr:hypothetical protein [Planctomycetales bacterium]